FISRWSNWWILNPKRKQLDDAFEKELNELQREQLKAFADYVQEREWEEWEDGDKDLSEFVDEFLRL
ncbi:MAG TPA: hypothetical protein GX745_08605, partial [Clostridiales bacterium]|nr:hypothetical protein [Clostridiales bacterium]